MTTTSTTTDQQGRPVHIAAALLNAPRVDTPERGFRVSRCDDHGAYAWKGTARPACPLCGRRLRTTTRQLRESFMVLEGELLAYAERLPGGLQADIDSANEEAESLREREARDRAKLEQRSGVSEDGYAWQVYYPNLLDPATGVRSADRPFVQSEYPKGSGIFRGGSSLCVDLSASIAKAEARAAKFERRLAKLGGPVA